MPGRIEYRSRGTRRETPLLFVMADGESERVYFDRLNLMVKTTRIKPIDLAKSGWKTILKKCDGYVKSCGIDLKSGDRLAIVTDDDGAYDEESISVFQTECKRKGYELFLSNVSFEVWLLMHYERFSIPYTQDELEERLTSHLGHKYRKSQGIPFDLALVKKAVGNAAYNLPEGDNADCLKRNPSTRLHFLVGEILDREGR